MLAGAATVLFLACFFLRTMFPPAEQYASIPTHGQPNEYSPLRSVDPALPRPGTPESMGSAGYEEIPTTPIYANEQEAEPIDSEATVTPDAVLITPEIAPIRLPRRSARIAARRIPYRRPSDEEEEDDD